MRWRAPCLVATLTLLASSFAGTAAAKKPPVISGPTLVYAFGTGAVDVTVPKGGVTLDEGLRTASGKVPGFATLFSADQWSAVTIVSRTTKVGGRPLQHAQVHLPAPDHCPSDLAPTVGPVPACTPFVEQTAHVAPAPTTTGAKSRWVLPAGTYQIVVSGPPGRVVLAALWFSGKGSRSLFAAGRATSTLQRVRGADVAAAHVAGTFSHQVRAGGGVAVVGVWHTTAGNEPGPFAFAECVVAGATEQTNPDDCSARDTARQAGGSSPVTPPTFAASSLAPVTVDNSGEVAYVTPPLKAATYTDAYRVARGGRGPGAGAWVWWVEADSLR